MVSKKLDDLFHKFMEQVESIFKNLPKPLRGRSFLNNDLILLTDIPLHVRDVSVKHDLNKSQTKALAKLEKLSGKVFHEIIQNGFIPDLSFFDPPCFKKMAEHYMKGRPGHAAAPEQCPSKEAPQTDNAIVAGNKEKCRDRRGVHSQEEKGMVPADQQSSRDRNVSAVLAA